MGYRSEVAFCLYDPNEATRIDNYEKIEAYVEDKMKNADTEDQRAVFAMLASMYDENDDVSIEFRHDWLKCYDPWDTCVHALATYAEELGLDYAYLRLGEDASDLDSWEKGQSVHIELIHKIGSTFIDK